jgi:hypothetical protein
LEALPQGIRTGEQSLQQHDSLHHHAARRDDHGQRRRPHNACILYLHRRTKGMIGSLLWLIRTAAINAILDGTEKITKTGLDAVAADIASQDPAPAPRSRAPVGRT